MIYDAEHFFDAWRDDPGYALECLRAAVAAGAENVTLCDTNGSSLPGQVAEATAAVVAELGDRAAGRHPHPQRRRVRGRQLARRGRGGRPPGPGHDERLRRALRQREPGLDPAGAAAQARLRVRRRRPDAPADRDRALRRRAHQHRRPTPTSPTSGRNAFAHKGGMHVAGVQADARTFEHIDPELVGNSRDVLISELSGKGSVLDARRERRDRARRRRGQARPSNGSRSASTAATTTRRPTPRSSCCCGARPATTSRCSGSRASG